MFPGSHRYPALSVDRHQCTPYAKRTQRDVARHRLTRRIGRAQALSVASGLHLAENRKSLLLLLLPSYHAIQGPLDEVASSVAESDRTRIAMMLYCFRPRQKQRQ